MELEEQYNQFLQNALIFSKIPEHWQIQAEALEVVTSFTFSNTIKLKD